METIVRVNKVGGPEVLELASAERAAPGHGEVWLEHDAIGVNYLDVMQRRGAAPISLPSGLGVEGVGRIVSIGAGVNGFQEGDRVGYVLGPYGSYASGRVYPADRLIRLPDALGSDDAAALLMKGITAHYLLFDTFQVKQGTRVLLYGAGGPLGQLMASWASHLGAKVIGVVSREESVERTLLAGCAEVIVWGSCDLPARVSELTYGAKVDVVYDGIGKATFHDSLDAVAPRGTVVSIGASSGAPAPIELSTLNAKGSIFLTRPSLAAHASSVTEYQSRAAAVLNAWKDGVLKPKVWKKYALWDVVEAHRALEAGHSEGAVILHP